MTTSLARELSEHVRLYGSIPGGQWRDLKASLSDEQVERIKAKAQWEQVSWLGVLADWPDLFEPPSPPAASAPSGLSERADSASGETTPITSTGPHETDPRKEPS